MGVLTMKSTDVAYLYTATMPDGTKYYRATMEDPIDLAMRFRHFEHGDFANSSQWSTNLIDELEAGDKMMEELDIDFMELRDFDDFKRGSGV
jgi:hypothetical protein